MALKKEYITNQGFTADYWKLDTFTADNNQYVAAMTLNLYLSKEKAEEEDAFIVSKTLTIYSGLKDLIKGEDGTDNLSETLEKRKELFNKYFAYDSDYDNFYNACYNYARDTDEYFADAEDC